MPMASWCFLAFILRSAILDVLDVMSLINDSVSPFPPFAPLPISLNRFLPSLVSSAEVWLDEEDERMLNKDDGVTID